MTANADSRGDYPLAVPEATVQKEQPFDSRPLLPPVQTFQASEHHYEPPAKPKSTWEPTKYFLHGCGILFGLVTVGLAAVLKDVWKAEIIQGGSIAVGALSVVWSGAEFASRFTKFRGRGMHPALHLVLTLLICVVSVGVAVFEARLLGFWSWALRWDVDDVPKECHISAEGKMTGNCPQFQYRKDIRIATAVFTAVLAAVYSCLFIIACLDLHKRGSVARLMSGSRGQWQTLPQQEGQGGVPLMGREASRAPTEYAGAAGVQEYSSSFGHSSTPSRVVATGHYPGEEDKETRGRYS